jgi:hypothetical protein
MRTGIRTWGLTALLLVSASGAIFSQESAPPPMIDPEADTVLRELSDHNKQIKTGVFRLTDTIDDVQADGRKLQFSHIREMTVSRPDKLKVETKGDVTNRTLWLDGKTLTVLDREKNVYAELHEPGNIEQAIDTLQAKYNMSVPAADLLSADVYKTLTEGCDTIEYIGLGFVGEEQCHHLAATRPNIDWQLWVTPGDKPSVRKMVITYKRSPGQPQYTMQLLSVKGAEAVKDSLFSAEVPKEAEKIEFHPAEMPR